MSERPAPVSLESLLRRCVECGLCLPHCATYLATGNEAQSPRGRLLLLGAVAAGELPADHPDVVAACDRCLGCLACTTVCPSGIEAELIARVQAAGRPAQRRAGHARPAPSILLERAALLRVLRLLATAARAALRHGLGRRWRRRLAQAPPPLPVLARLLGALPGDPGDDRRLVRLLDGIVVPRGGAATPTGPAAVPVPAPASAAASAAASATGPAAVPAPASAAASATVLAVAWFRGCADAALLPRTADRLRRLLTGLGCRLIDPAGQDCCGAQAAHDHRSRRAASLQARNLAALAPDPPPADDPLVDHVVVAAAGCGHHLRSYPSRLADRVIDATVLLARLVDRPLGPVPLRVALHDSCHARHGQGIVTEPRELLRRIPQLELIEPEEAEVCCGAAGTYALRHGELSTAMGRRKAGVLGATGCDLVVTTNVGCLGQLAHALAQRERPVPVLPLSDLVWYAWRRRGAGKEPLR